MSRTADSFYNFGKEVFGSIGFGNEKALMAFGVSTIVAALAIAGLYIPPLGLMMNWLLPLVIGTGTCCVFSLLGDLELTSILCGLLLALATGGISYLLCASLTFIAPFVTSVLFLPNVVAAGSYFVGGIVSCVDSVWTGIKDCVSAIGKSFGCCYEDGSREDAEKKPLQTNNASLHNRLPAGYTSVVSSSSGSYVSHPANDHVTTGCCSWLNPLNYRRQHSAPPQPAHHDQRSDTNRPKV